MTESKLDLIPFEKLAGSTGAAEVLHHIYTECRDGVFKPKSTRALQHLISLGYLKPDYGRGVLIVCQDKINQDLQTAHASAASV